MKVGRKFGHSVSAETRKKMSLAKKGKPSSRKNYKHSEDTRIKISLSKTGLKQTVEHIEKRMANATGEKHWGWKGDDVGYTSLHRWVRKQLGAKNKCEHCLSESKKKYEWSNKSHQYNRRDTNDWVRLCTSCHRKYDLENGLVKMRKIDLLGRFIKE